MSVLMVMILLIVGAVCGFMLAALIAIAADDRTNEKSEKKNWWNDRR